jgi:HEAT repeat protein
MEEPPVEALIVRALTEEPDSDARWKHVSVLWGRGDEETFVAASRLCDGSDPVERTLGADILGQLGARPGGPIGERPFRDQSVEILLRRIATESDPRVLTSMAAAFGHLDDARCVPALHALRGHADCDIRWGVVFGLLGLDDDLAVETLVELSRDESADVRDWATFGLGSLIERDTSDVREALFVRLDDPDDDTREEALVGLSERGDVRAVDPLIAELEKPPEAMYGSLLIDALLALATRTQDERLCRRVRAVRDSWCAEELAEPLPDDLEEALQGCAER